jgi:rhodanese-related sulfurtransferase
VRRKNLLEKYKKAAKERAVELNRSTSNPLLQNSSRSRGLPSVVNVRNEHDYSFDRPDDESTLSNFHRDDESVDGSSHPDEGDDRHDSFDVPATDDDDDQVDHEESTLSSSNFFRGVQSEDGSWHPRDERVIVPCRGRVQTRYFTKGNPRNELYPETEVIDVHLESMSETTCAICLDEYVRGQTRIILPCLHGFHSNCIKRCLPKELKSGCWTIVAGGKCPECRTPCIVEI